MMHPYVSAQLAEDRVRSLRDEADRYRLAEHYGLAAGPPRLRFARLRRRAPRLAPPLAHVVEAFVMAVGRIGFRRRSCSASHSVRP